MYCSNTDLNKFCLRLVTSIIVCQTIYCTQTNVAYLFKEYINCIVMLVSLLVSKYLNLVFFFPILSSYFIESFILMLLHLFIYYQIMLIIFCIYAFYFHLRGLQICSLVALVNIWCQKQWSMVCKYWFILWSSLWIFQYQIEQRLL